MWTLTTSSGWARSRPVRSKADAVGIAHTQPYGALEAAIAKALAASRKIHFLPPSRYYNTLKLQQLVPGRKPSEALVKAVISLRLVKEDIEIEAIDAACALGYEMHSVARDAIVPGIVEQEIVGKMEGVALAKGWGVSFPTILTQHGETLHNHIPTRLSSPAS